MHASEVPTAAFYLIHVRIFHDRAPDSPQSASAPENYPAAVSYFASTGLDSYDGRTCGSFLPPAMMHRTKAAQL